MGRRIAPPIGLFADGMPLAYAFGYTEGLVDQLLLDVLDGDIESVAGHALDMMALARGGARRAFLFAAASRLYAMAEGGSNA